MTPLAWLKARAGWIAFAALVAVDVVAFLRLGLHERVPLIWGFSFGTVDLLIGTGMIFGLAFVPYILAKDEREARILVLSTWLILGWIMIVLA